MIFEQNHRFLSLRKSERFEIFTVHQPDTRPLPWILRNGDVVCVFTPFFTDFPMPYPFSPYSLMVYTANLDDLSPDFLPRKSGFYHIYIIYTKRPKIVKKELNYSEIKNP